MPRGDLRRSADRVPSRWVLDIASALAQGRWWAEDLLSADVCWVDHVASFDAGLRKMLFPATEQEHRLRTLLDHARAGGAVTTHELRGVDVASRRGIEAVAAPRGPELEIRPAQR